MRRAVTSVLILSVGVLLACSTDQTTGGKLRQWRRGVWLLADGSYAIYTDDHYFVVSTSGDSAQANVYCGGSQIRITDKGMARKQTVRIRKFPGGDLQLFKEMRSPSEEGEVALDLDMEQFEPGKCNVHEGVIYDSVTEEADQYILLTTCNGDKEKIFYDGRSVYMPASGGEFWAYRIESW
jgi:hypothetical protein